MKRIDNTFLSDLLAGMEMAPHGSGINYDYTLYLTDKELVVCNTYDCMNENGFYDGIIDFSVYIPMVKPSDFTIRFRNTKANTNSIRKYGFFIKEYLEMLYSDWLVELGFNY